MSNHQYKSSHHRHSDGGGNHRKSGVTWVKVGTNPINAISLCEDNNRVVIAGRSLLKVFTYDENKCKFSETVNLQVGRREQGLNMSSADVAWSKIDHNLIATGATNGAVVAWDLTTMGRNKQLAIFNEHSRSVSKISFHPTEGSMLLSGSQDSSIKLFDIRKKQCSNTFYGHDGIRCIQFSPFNYFHFASSMDNGYVNIWDYRKTNCCLFEFIAHKGSVYTLDWHPDPEEKDILVTGGRDKTVKVWDTSTAACKRRKEIPVTAAVSTVKWRPNHREQLATSYMIMDYNINLWDLRRVHVPYAQFQDHSEITAGVAWKRNDPRYLYSCSKDGTLMIHSLEDNAKFSSDVLKASGLAVNNHGYVVVAGNMGTYTRPSSPLSTDEKFSTTSTTIQQPSKGFSGILNRINSAKSSDDEHNTQSSSPNTSSFLSGYLSGDKSMNTTITSQTITNTHQHQDEYKLRDFLSWNSNIIIHQATELDKVEPCVDMNDYRTPNDTLTEELTMNGFDHAARNYIIDGGENNQLTFAHCCQLNSKVALEAGQPIVARTWLLLLELYDCDVSMAVSGSKPASLHGGGGLLSRTHSDAAYIERSKRGSGDKESKRSSLIAIHKDELTSSQTILNGATITTNMGGGGVGDYDDSDFSIENQRGEHDFLIEMARANRASPTDLYFSENDVPITKFSDMLIETDVLSDNNDWEESVRVPSEAFALKEDIGMDAMTSLAHFETHYPTSDDAVTLQQNRRVVVQQDETSTYQSSHHHHHHHRHHQQIDNVENISSSSSDIPSTEVDQLDVSAADYQIQDVYLTHIDPPHTEDVIAIVKDEVMTQQFNWLVENGKVQAVVSMMLLMQSYPAHPSFLRHLPSNKVDYWQHAYVDLLFNRKLFVQRAKVIKMSRVSSVQALSHSSSVYLRCEKYRVRLKNGTVPVGKTRKGSDRFKYILCSICQLPVRGLLLFCQTCGLSAHDSCVKSWFQHLSQERKDCGCLQHSF